MEYLTKSTETALNRYFTHLSQFGYMNDLAVGLLLLLTFLNNFLQEFIVTELDYRKISLIISCLLQSSCMVPYESYVLAVESIESYLFDLPVRITEDSATRMSEDNEVRIVNL